MSLSALFFGLIMTLVVGLIGFAIVTSDLNGFGNLEMRGFWEVLRPNELCEWLKISCLDSQVPAESPAPASVRSAHAIGSHQANSQWSLR